MKYIKEIVLALAPYKTVKLGVSEADSFEQCDNELMTELDKHEKLKNLNLEDIEKVIDVKNLKRYMGRKSK